jgi:cysteinyl-tRNA synthetase
MRLCDFVGELVDKGFAYVGNDGVYFSVEKFPEYTKLSHYDLDELIQNARKEINKDSGKKDQVDFVLWKFKKEGEPAWPSPWGEGRPGWHIECSAMARKYLGQTIDIHCGGQDLIFPHHENEIAQSEAANGKPFVHYWMHNGFITVNHSKMSKSEGNFFTVREISEKVGYMPIRLFILSSHYRSPINYSLDLVEQAGRAYERIETCWKNMQFLLDNNPDAVDEEQREALSNLVRQKQADFDESHG